jgi:hypothetical protein
VIFRRNRGGTEGNGAQAVREPEADRAAEREAKISALAQGLPPLEELLAEIDSATGANGSDRGLETDRRILELRHLAGVQLIAEAPRNPEFATPDFDALPDGPGPVEISPQELTPELLRAAILTHGCLLVRGLVERDAALELAAGIDQAFEARASVGEGRPATEGYYEEFNPESAFRRLGERAWIEQGGGVLAVDSPKVLLDTLDALGRVNFPSVVHGYLGERGAISAEKTTLRKAEPDVSGAWHQDGKFLGDVHALNLWLSLSRCGDEAPGLDIVPRRIDHIVAAGTEGMALDYLVSDETVKEAAGGVEVQRPIFEPGDALLFDDLFLHQTGSDPEMPKPRYALESWFFGPSAFPNDYSPVAV